MGSQGFLHHALAGGLFGEFGFDKEAVDFLSQGVAFGRAAAGDDNIRAFGSKDRTAAAPMPLAPPVTIMVLSVGRS